MHIKKFEPRFKEFKRIERICQSVEPQLVRGAGNLRNQLNLSNPGSKFVPSFYCSFIPTHRDGVCSKGEHQRRCHSHTQRNQWEKSSDKGLKSLVYPCNPENLGSNLFCHLDTRPNNPIGNISGEVPVLTNRDGLRFLFLQ